MSWNIQKPGDYINGPLTVAGVAQFNSNVGIGTTPSGWGGTGFLNLPSNTAVSFKGTQGSVISNAYYDTQWRYYGNGRASQYYQNDGVHTWLVAPNNISGAAAALTFATGMTLDSTGNLFTSGSGNGANLNVTTSSQVCGLRLRQTQNVHPATRNWSIYTNGSAYGVLEFGVGASQFSDSYATVLTVDGAGNVTPNGNLVPAAGKGIDFSAASNAAGASSELLNDYEEGTFTPTVIGVSTAGTGNYTVQVGRYTKTGNRVNVDIYVNWNTHTGTGALRITGLPFLVKSAANYYASVTIGYVSLTTLNANNVLNSLANGASAYIDISQYPAGGGTTGPVSIGVAGALCLSVSYEV
jgi:hypothetical protein